MLRVKTGVVRNEGVRLHLPDVFWLVFGRFWVVFGWCFLLFFCFNVFGEFFKGFLRSGSCCILLLVGLWVSQGASFLAWNETIPGFQKNCILEAVESAHKKHLESTVYKSQSSGQHF